MLSTPQFGSRFHLNIQFIRQPIQKEPIAKQILADFKQAVPNSYAHLSADNAFIDFACRDQDDARVHEMIETKYGMGGLMKGYGTHVISRVIAGHPIHSGADLTQVKNSMKAGYAKQD